ncbi:YadA family autotransporter adhesin, partial [Haemophilus parainfluenzae]|uniref:YadA family autotransporter adhesin n=1 Tax=Haemophilus parainfluenzae TaxID=729 RepID=UPI000B1AA553
GWNLQANGQPVDAVTHGNNVNFASDNSVKITPTTDGNTSTINLSVNATNVVEQVTGNVSANMTTGKAVVGKDGNENTSTDAGNKVATVGDVANTINNTGWITKTTDGANVTVNPGDRVEYVDGKGTTANVTVTNTNGQDVVNVTYDVKTDGKTVTVNNDGNLSVVTGNITKASDDVTQPNAGKVTVTTGDENKVATVKNVADAINSAGWIVNTGKADNQDSFKTETGTPTKVGAGDNVNFQAGKNLEVKRDGQNIIYATSEDLDAKTITVTTVKVGNDGKDGKPGVDGSIGVTGKDGAAVAINGKDGSIGLTGPKGADGKDGASVTIKPEKGTTTVAERDGGKEINRVTYTDKDKDGNDIKREIATLDDGLKFTGDDGQTVNRTLGSNLNVKGGATTSTTAKNIRVTKAADGQGLDVNLANNIELDNNGSIKIGDTTVNQDGITINNGPSVTKGGIDAGGKTITNVAPGKNGTDAVNVDQLRGSLTNIQGDIHKARKEGRAGIAGANAAAGLPQVYLPGKSMVAASAGTFKGQNALAVGYSRSSDNGKVIFKLQGNANTQGDVGGSVGIGYQW